MTHTSAKRHACCQHIHKNKKHIYSSNNEIKQNNNLYLLWDHNPTEHTGAACLYYIYTHTHKHAGTYMEISNNNVDLPWDHNPIAHTGVASLSLSLYIYIYTHICMQVRTYKFQITTWISSGIITQSHIQAPPWPPVKTVCYKRHGFDIRNSKVSSLYFSTESWR